MKLKLTGTVLWAMACLGAAQAQVVEDTAATRQVPVVQLDTIRAEETRAAAKDSLTTIADGDTVKAKKKRFLYSLLKEDYPNPNKALYFSLALPGAGQIYNRRWWKAPLVWGADGWLIYVSQYNARNYKRFRDAYVKELNKMEHEFTGTGLKADDLKRLRDQFDKRKQLSYIGIFAVHLVQAAEAFVDCHLKTFDVSDDLSLQWQPSIEATPFAGPAIGVGLSLRLGK